MAFFYLFGLGVLPDYQKAMALLLVSATDNNILATALLGNCLLEGLGIEKNIKEGLKYLKLAAEKALLYLDVAQDNVNR